MVSKKKRPQTEADSTSTSEVTARKRVRSNENAGSSTATTKPKESSKTGSKSSKKGTVSKGKEEALIGKTEEEDVDDVRAHNNNSVLVDADIPDWPEADLMELMKRMENNIPAKDNLRYDSRAEKLNWEEISFGNYTARECKEIWFKIQKRLRRFRILKELLEDAKSWVSKPWTHFYRGQRQNRHPDLPRRPLSTYMLFYLEKKDKVAKENPGLEMTNVSKYIAELYNKLPAKKKQKYVDMAATQKKEYEEKMELFYQEHPELIPKAVALKEARANTASSTEVGPKKPQTPFKLFCNEKLNQNKNDQGFDRNAVLENCKEQWRDMSEKKKIVWIDWALEEEAKYQEEVKAYTTENPEFVPPTIKSVLTKDEIALKERIAGKPEKPPTSGYSLFSRLMLVSPDMKKVPPKERMTQVSRMWKSLTNEQKKKYKEQVLHMLDQYKLEYASYLESLPEEKRKEELSSCTPKKKLPIKKKAGKKAAKKKLKPEGENSKLFKGEPEPPPLNAYQLFLKGFMADASHIPMENREKEAPRYWQMLPPADKEKHRKKLNDIKQKYIKDYEKFLKGLSQEELKEYSMQKAKLKQNEDAQSSSDSETEDGSKESEASEKDSDSDANSSSDSDSDSDDSSDSDSDADKAKESEDSSSITSSTDSESD